MEDQFDLEGFTLREIRAMRMALNSIQINGIDASFIGSLQAKLDAHIHSIEELVNQQPIIPPPPPLETK
jgi:hypothetical protein|tara:strand:- start:1764 stop:1970 length:207 start_codon:yes stop_codon:yes gene_type:complete